MRTSAHEVFIAPKRSDNGGWGASIIPSKVTEVAWNETYIMAKQLDLKADPESSSGHQIPDEPNEHFWLLTFQTGEVIGPLDNKSFVAKKNELGIPDDVVL